MKTFLKISGVILIGIAILFAIAYWFVFGRGAATGDGVVLQTWSDAHIEGIPVALDMDPYGRAWVVETNQFNEGVGDMRFQTYWAEADMLSESTEDRLAYIENSIANGDLDASFFDNDDALRVVVDTDGNGKADDTKILKRWQGYLDGVAAGVLVAGNNVWVTNIPNVWRLSIGDMDSELSALDVKKSEILSTGWGLRTAFVGHDMHGLTWGPDGKIYFSIGDRGFNVINKEGKNIQPPLDQGRGGVLRMNPDGSELELFHVGLRNPQEIAFDNYGNLITADNNSDGGDEARIVYVTEGGDSGWTYGYQYMAYGDYLRGPWNAEKLWYPAHEGQPAWVTPALANLTNGPSGVAHYPGIGLPERYENHFFVANYSFVPLNSYILSFEIQPDGAGFTVEDVHRFIDRELVIDQNFGYDGKLYALSAAVFGGAKKILQIYGEAEHADADNQTVFAEVTALFQEGMSAQPTGKLLSLLSHKDQRVRLHSQYELARRNTVSELTALAKRPQADELSRIHALWGLGQMGAKSFASWTNFSEFTGEILAQAIKVAGDAGAEHLLGGCDQHLENTNARVQYFSALCVGKLAASTKVSTSKKANAVDSIVTLLSDNNDSDPFIRHAGIFALSRINQPNLVLSLANHENASVRLAAVVALRQMEHSGVARFLADSNPLVVVEAARAIHDLRMSEALPALAQLAATDLGSDSDPQSGLALHRRVINAALLLGTEDSAVWLATYAARESHPIDMRELALETLAVFAQPPRADFVWGDHLVIETRPANLAHKAIDSVIAKMLDGDLGAKAMDVALAHNRVPLDDKALATLIADKNADLDRRISGLQALAKRHSAKNNGLLSKVLKSAANSRHAQLRITALRALVQHDPGSAARAVLATAEGNTSLAERQAAIALLPTAPSKEGAQWLKQALNDASFATELKLDVLLAAEQMPSLKETVAEWRKQQQQRGPFAEKQLALSGGDVQRGKELFGTGGDCLRCHIVDGKGGVAGPDLTGVASLYSAQYLLDALVQPSKDLAPGYANVVLTLSDGSSLSGVLISESNNALTLQVDTGHGQPIEKTLQKSNIAQKQGPFSGMPPMGLALPTKDTRDIMAYLKTLR